MPLDEKLQSAIKGVIARYSEMERDIRYMHVQRVSLNRAYQRGMQADFFDPVDLRWRPFTDDPEYRAKQRQERRSHHHVPIVQAVWEILQAALSTTGVPASNFRPQNPNETADIMAAKVADPIAKYERDLNNYQRLWLRNFRYQFTDGISLFHVNHIRNEQMLGTDRIMVNSTEPQMIKPAGTRCVSCNELTPEGGEATDESGLIVACPHCGTPLMADMYEQPEYADIPISETAVIPKGREFLKIYGLLESRLPPWSQGLEDAPYAAIELNVDRNSVIPAFPEMEEEILGATSQSVDDEAGDFARRMSISPAGTWSMDKDLGIYRRWWLRPEAFYSIRDKEERKAVMDEYPEGALVQLLGDVFLDCRPEKMDEHLFLCRTFDCDGMFPPAMGDAGVPIQKSLNTAFNLKMDAQEYASFPPVLADRGVLSTALKNIKMRAAQLVFIDLPPGKSLRESYHQMVVKEMSAGVQQIVEEAFRWMEYLIGAQPALFGASIKNVRTAQGYETAKNQALQRLGPPYEESKICFAKADELLVHSFLRNRRPEEFISIVGPGTLPQAEALDQLSPAQGRIFAKSEMTDAVPATWAQVQTSVARLMDSQNPVVQQWLNDPNNSEIIYRALGIPGLTVPGRTQRDKAERLIPLLRQGAAVQPDPILDDLQAQLRVIQEWAATDEGLDIMLSNPEEFARVRQYAELAANILSSIAAPPPQQQQAKPAGRPAAA